MSGNVSMANDVHQFKMAAKIATTNTTYDKLTITTSFFFILSAVPIYYALAILLENYLNKIFVT